MMNDADGLKDFGLVVGMHEPVKDVLNRLIIQQHIHYVFFANRSLMIQHFPIFLQDDETLIRDPMDRVC